MSNILFVTIYIFCTLLFFFVAKHLNQTRKWITLDTLTNFNGDLCILLIIIGTILWPITLFFKGFIECMNLFADFCKRNVPKN